jgi:hypothetical protein
LAKSFLLFLIYYTIVFEFHHHLHFSFVFHESGVFEKAINYFRTSAPELKEERAMLLEEWLNMESSFGKLGDVSLVQSKLPKKLKKRRQIVTEDGPSGYVSPTLIFLCKILMLVSSNIPMGSTITGEQKPYHFHLLGELLSWYFNTEIWTFEAKELCMSQESLVGLPTTIPNFRISLQLPLIFVEVLNQNA